MRKLLYELSFDDAGSWLSHQGQKPFRARQLFEWAYEKNARTFEEMTNLPADLREVLAGSFQVGPLPVLDSQRGPDAHKLLVQMPRGGEVECVAITMGNTRTACLSSQVGCDMRCVFCATGQTKCERSLESGEIIAQLITLRATGNPMRPLSNVVFMGMGEPFANYDNVVRAIRLITDKRALGISPSKVTVSTAGIVPMIRKYAQEGLPTELAVSLNAPNDEIRRRLMPGVDRWSVAEIAAVCKEYSAATGGQPVTFAYVLISGVNDLLDHAYELARLLRHQPHHVNVIPLNPVGHCEMVAPDKQRTSAFVHHCRQYGLNASVRKSKGREIDGACGQLRGRRGS